MSAYISASERAARHQFGFRQSVEQRRTSALDAPLPISLAKSLMPGAMEPEVTSDARSSHAPSGPSPFALRTVNVLRCAARDAGRSPHGEHGAGRAAELRPTAGALASETAARWCSIARGGRERVIERLSARLARAPPPRNSTIQARTDEHTTLTPHTYKRGIRRHGCYSLAPPALFGAWYLTSSADSTAACAAAHIASASPAGICGCTVMMTFPGNSCPSRPGGRVSAAVATQRRRRAHRCA